MKNIVSISVYLFLLTIGLTSFAQNKKIVVLGSSTAFGTGATPTDSGWVGKLRAYFNRNTTDGNDTTVDNRAVGGYDTYKSLPDGYPTPLDRPAPDPNANITYVLTAAQKADVVIINYPTNDIAYGYSPKEMMDNLRLMFKTLSDDNGIRTYITTSQPRDLSNEQRIVLRNLVDSIQINFKDYAINFWDDIVTTDGSYTIRSEVSYGDGTHVNNLGHQLLFERVLAKNIFAADSPLPVTLKNWKVSVESTVVKLNWNTAFEDPGTSFEIQRSANGTTFQTVARINGTGHDANYSWTDVSPLPGKSFYRLKIIEVAKLSYSLIIPIINDKRQLISSFYVDGSQIHLQFNGDRSQVVFLSIIGYSGAVIKQQTVDTHSNPRVTIPISDLSSGNYILQIRTSNGVKAVERFTKMK